MNLTLARNILEVSEDATIDTIRRQYKIKALKYHPDKNPSPTATEDFRNIHEAYRILIAHHDNVFLSRKDGDEPIDIPSYHKVLFSFLSTFLNNMGQPQGQSSPQSPKDCRSKELFESKMKLIFSCILNMCESKAVEYVKKLDVSTLEKTVGIINQYRDVFRFTDVFLEKIQSIISDKQEKQNANYQYFILNPFLEDLFEDNLYRFTMNNQTYIVPLWHQELMYDGSGEDIIVQCCPVLPENVEIDVDNNVIYELYLQISDAFNKKDYCFDLCGKWISFDASKLQLTGEKQTIVFKNEGISKVNDTDMFNVSVRSDIIINIYLENNRNI